MRICLLGDCAGNIDEGMKKITSRLGQELSRRHDVMTLDPRSAVGKAFWSDLRAYAPDVIHYVPGPSFKSFVVVRAAALGVPAAKTVMSAPLPLISGCAAKLVRFVKPDLVLAQSRAMERRFTEWGLETRLLPVSGVDVQRFRPAGATLKRELRQEYGLGQDQFVVLHVGHVKSKRNVQLLKRLQRRGLQTMVVGSTSTGVEAALANELVSAGCRVVTEYVQHIEDIYRLSDCYVFPTPPDNKSACIEIPLSVLEAAACGLPIVSTRFGAVPEIFEGVSGFSLSLSETEMVQTVEGVGGSDSGTRTRERALPFSWDNISRSLESQYEELIYG